ncbi:MAG: HAD-IC family P-type ATPase, partial [Candidatus Adiutrix sp.]|nr:HAD-IC family P-type ATPase [Candidatus Adiutrix sp.]
LVLATPTAIMAGIGNAARYGILISQGDALERLAKVSRIAFDKTGTLTIGKPAVVLVTSCQPSVSAKDVLENAASAELRSEHPLGKAIAAHYKREYQQNPAQPDDFRLLAGRGVFASVNGQAIDAGNEALLSERGFSVPEHFSAEIADTKNSGALVMYIMNSQAVLGYIALSDTLRPDAAAVVKSIEKTGTKTLLLTGDSPQAAEHRANMAGIADVQAACLPEDKLAAIRRYQAEGEPVCMVGDGINDAPALKAAQVGIAMGGIGSDIAVEAADIVLVGDDIKEIPHLLSLAKRVMGTIKLNLTAAMLLNFAAIALAITGILNPVSGALVHNAGSVAVIINSYLLLRWRAKVSPAR